MRLICIVFGDYINCVVLLFFIAIVMQNSSITLSFKYFMNNVILKDTKREVVGMGIKEKTRMKARLSSYMNWPIYFCVFWIIITVLTWYLHKPSGIIMSVAVAMYIIASLVVYLRFNLSLTKRLMEFGAAYSQVQRQMLHELEIPYALMEHNGRIMWTNHQLDKLTDGKSIKNKFITNVFEGLTVEDITLGNAEKTEFSLNHNGRNYRVVLKLFSLKDDVEESQAELFDSDGGSLLGMYMFDETLINQLTKENKEEKLVTSHIYIDNYDEVVQSIEETRRTLLVALIDRRINKYFAQYDGIVKKLENDKYFVVFKAKYINKMQTDKFSILDEVKTVNIGNGMPVTISIGVGLGGNSFMENYDLAGVAIDIALGRGGDQAVIKDGNKVYHYGGKSKSVEKNTKVKSRVKATAFRDLIETKEKIYIMGHHIGDNDSFGAAVGLYRIGKTIGKEAHIVLGEVSSSVEEMISAFKETEGYSDMIITGAQAVANITKNDVLVIVDCSRANYTEEPELVRRAQCIVVFDHHRQTKDVIDDAQLDYIELSASSTCEMVVEIMQYINETVRLSKIEAEAMYAGVMVDTNNFTNRTGVRTFEAAAYLRKHGADITKVRRMFRNGIDDYKVRAMAINNTEVFMKEYAISICDGDGVVSPTVVGAQVANELLNVKDIKASFVCTPYNGKIYISARSLDKINVQVLMEEFGGGGHMNLAGAQVDGATASEVVETLKKVIRTKIEEGDI